MGGQTNIITHEFKNEWTLGDGDGKGQDQNCSQSMERSFRCLRKFSSQDI